MNEDDCVDVVVVGSGVGLIGAYAAATRGLRTPVIEKISHRADLHIAGAALGRA